MKWSTFGLIALTALVSSGIGTFLGYNHADTDPIEVNKVDLQENDIEEGVIFNVTDFEVVVLPEDHKEMEGRLGFYRFSQPDRIYLQYMNTEQFYQTCVHEEMHLKGVRAERHDYIENVEDTIVSDNCLEAVEKLGQHRPVENRRLFQ